MTMNCDPCSCPEQYYRNDQAWKKGVMIIFCTIKELIENIITVIAPAATSHVNTDEAAAQSHKELIAAPTDATQSIYITDITISNGATAGWIELEEDTAGAQNPIYAKLYAAINGGCIHALKTPIKCTAGANVGFTSNTVTTHSIQLGYYIA